MSDLKPCPYCGERGEIQETYWPNERKSEWYAWCPGECISVKPRETREEAACVWNEVVDAISAYRRTCQIVNREGFAYCSTCKAHVEGYYEDATDRYPMRFCPSCGAKVVDE